VAIDERVLGLGEEFSDYILVDNTNNSIVINIELKFLDITIQEYQRLGYKLIHNTKFKSKNSATCVFTEVS
jgi:hypothetical protein